MTASKQARIEAAWKLYRETAAAAAKLHEETANSLDSAWKLYRETKAKIEAEP